MVDFVGVTCLAMCMDFIVTSDAPYWFDNRKRIFCPLVVTRIIWRTVVPFSFIFGIAVSLLTSHRSSAVPHVETQPFLSTVKSLTSTFVILMFSKEGAA